MPVESASYATQFNTSSPASTDPRSEGDDHLRLIKSVIATELNAANRGWAYSGLSAVWHSATSVCFDTDETTTFVQGRRVKAVGSGTGTIYGAVSSATYSAATTVHVDWFSGSLSDEALQFFLGPHFRGVPGSILDLRNFADLSRGDDIATALQAAIDYVETTGGATTGGLIFIPSGNWQVGATVNIGAGTAAGRVTLMGEGTATRLDLADNVDGYMFDVKDGYTQFENLMIDANKANQASGGGITFDNSNSFVGLRYVRIQEGKDYCLQVNGAGNLTAFRCEFRSGTKGIFLANSACANFYVCNVEDNTEGGVEYKGGASNSNVNFHGTYFENNGDGAANGAGPYYHIDSTAIQAHTVLTAIGCYFNGNVSQTAMGGIKFSPGVVLDNWLVEGCVFRQLDHGAYNFDDCSTSNVGDVYLRGNTYQDSDPWSAGGVYGFHRDVTYQGVALSDEMSLVGSATVQLFIKPSDRPLRVDALHALYTQAETSGNVAEINVGRNGANNAFYQGTSPASVTINTVAELTATTSVLDAGTAYAIVAKVDADGGTPATDGIVKVQMGYTLF